MRQPIGSVYLDQPRPRRAPATPRRSFRSVAAAQLVLIGLAGLTIAGVLVGIRELASDPDVAVRAVREGLDDPDAQPEIRAEIAEAIETGLFGPEMVGAAEAFGFDYRSELDAWAAAVLDDPAFEEAVGEVVADIHQRIFVTPSDAPVDVGPVTDAVVAAAAANAPTLAPILPPGGQLWSVDGSGLPDLSGPTRAMDRALLGAVVAGLALPVAAAVHDRRHRVMAWVGRWFLVASTALGLAAFGLPHLAERAAGSVIAETATRSVSLDLLAPAAIIGAVGIGLASSAAVLRGRERRKVVDEGAAAWLDVVEPAPATTGSPSLDLARRGLVDGGRHLTSN